MHINTLNKYLTGIGMLFNKIYMYYFIIKVDYINSLHLNTLAVLQNSLPMLKTHVMCKLYIFYIIV